MVLTPGRKIADEYEAEKSTPSGPYHIDQAELTRAKRNWRTWVLERVTRKFEAALPDFDDLVIYNNVSNLFETDGWELLRPSIAEIVSKGWQGRVWQHRSVTLDELWPTVRRFEIPH